MFQSAVRFDQGTGIPGEKAYDGPTRSEPGILATAGTVGRAFSEDPAKPGFWTQGLKASAIRFALLVNPKQYAARGTSAGGTLAATLELPANDEGEFASMGYFYALAANADSKPGDVVYFANATGIITTTAPGASPPATSTRIPGAVVAPLPGGNRETPAAAGLICISLTGPTATA